MSSEGTGKMSHTYLDAHIRWNGNFFAYWESVGRGDVTDRYMSFHMKFAAAKLGYPSRNILIDSINTQCRLAQRSEEHHN